MIGDVINAARFLRSVRAGNTVAIDAMRADFYKAFAMTGREPEDALLEADRYARYYADQAGPPSDDDIKAFEDAFDLSDGA